MKQELLKGIAKELRELQNKNWLEGYDSDVYLSDLGLAYLSEEIDHLMVVGSYFRGIYLKSSATDDLQVKKGRKLTEQRFSDIKKNVLHIK